MALQSCIAKDLREEVVNSGTTNGFFRWLYKSARQRVCEKRHRKVLAKRGVIGSTARWKNKEGVRRGTANRHGNGFVINGTSKWVEKTVLPMNRFNYKNITIIIYNAGKRG